MFRWISHYIFLLKKNKLNCWLLLVILRLDNLVFLVMLSLDVFEQWPIISIKSQDWINLTEWIEAKLPLHVGHEVSRNIICWERSYWFSTPRRFFVCLCFLLEGLFTHKKKSYAWCSILKYLKPTPPKVYHDLTCYNNFRGE